MYILYSVLVELAGVLLKGLAWFSPKLRLFVDGRKQVKELLKAHVGKEDRWIWFHAASLGEFEQGVPVIEAVRTEFPNRKILVTFFSPSGYEVRKGSPLADLVCYLPLDSVWRVNQFLDLLRPELAVFIKYEFWPNFLRGLHQRGVPVLLISAVFRPNQAFFKWFGGFMRKSLRQFDHLFVQEEDSKTLLNAIGIDQVTVSGDTRFDRVAEILERNNALPFLEGWGEGRMTVVAGSTWPEDEEVLLAAINDPLLDVNWIIAPHEIKKDKIDRLIQKIDPVTERYTDLPPGARATARVLIADTIGLLTRLYSYADVAYVGGAMGKTGLHNILEPAVFGIPVIIGPNYDGFPEAAILADKGGVKVIRDAEEFKNVIFFLRDNPNKLRLLGNVNREYTEKSKGAKIQIAHHIRTIIE